jgi:hypothetical protein
MGGDGVRRAVLKAALNSASFFLCLGGLGQSSHHWTLASVLFAGAAFGFMVAHQLEN